MRRAPRFRCDFVPGSLRSLPDAGVILRQRASEGRRRRHAQLLPAAPGRAGLSGQADAPGECSEDEASLLQYGHGIGLSLWERPIISRRFGGQKTVLKEGMVFAVETWKGAADGSGAARIEEEVVVTKNGCDVITNFPSDRLISCGLPGCDVF